MRKTKSPLILAASSYFDEAVSVFKAGGVIAYPTETFYGLCVDPFNPEAVDKLFRLKGRPEKSPITVIISGPAMLKDVADEVPPAAVTLMDEFWPGPLTIIFKAASSVPPVLTAGTGTIGVRVSGSPVATRLSKRLSSPITATSANPSGKRPPEEASEVLKYFDGSIDILIDGGRLSGELPSTLIDMTGKEPRIVREGRIPVEDIMKALRRSRHQ